MATLVFKDYPASWFTDDFPNVPLTRVSWDTAPDVAVAWVFFGHPSIDFDGSPTAYAPEGHVPKPDDDLKHAIDIGTNSWVGVVAMSPTDPLVTKGTVEIDQSDKKLARQGLFPVKQQAQNGDPKPGFYVSRGARASGPLYMQNSYLDASQVSFGALSAKLRSLGFRFGDYGLALRHDKDLQSGFYFADSAPNNHKLGECSHHVGKNLGGSGRSDQFDNNFPVSFILFPGSFTIDPCDHADDDDCALPAISDTDIAKELKPLLLSLAQASNADELALLMGFNEVAPGNVPQGTSKLTAFLKSPKLSGLPVNYRPIVQALRSWGCMMSDPFRAIP